MILMPARTGYAGQGGSRSGFVSLAGLETSELIRFDRLDRGVGDLRDRNSAGDAL